MNFDNLRKSNKARQIEWPGNDQADLAFRALEVCGETGEFAEAAIDLLKLKHKNLDGAKEALSKLVDEMADVIISLDLIAAELRVDLNVALASKIDKLVPIENGVSFECVRLFNKSNRLPGYGGELVDMAFVVLSVCKSAGVFCESVKKYLRKSRSIAGTNCSLNQVVQRLADIIIDVDLMADMLSIDLGLAVSKKFNKTSEKYGLTTMLQPNAA